MIEQFNGMFNSKSRFFLIGLLLLLGFALRIHQIDHSSMWVDEGASIGVAHYPVAQILESEITIQDSAYRDSHPPFYYLILAGGRRLLGESDFSYRYISVIFSTLALLLIYKLGTTLHSVEAGLISLGLSAINPVFIQYAQEARMYTLIIFLSAAVTLCLIHLLRKIKTDQDFSITNLWPLAAVSFLLAFTNYPAWSFIALQALFVVLAGWRLGFKKSILTLAGTALIFLMAFWLYFRPDLPYFGSAILDPLLLAQFALQLIESTFILSATPQFLNQPAAIKIVFGLTIYLATIIGLFNIQSRLSRRVMLAHWLAVPFTLFAMEIISPGFQNIFHIRHILLSTIAIFIFVGIGLATLLKSSSRINLIMGLILLGLIGLSSAEKTLAFYPDEEGSQKDDYRGLVQTIMQHAGTSDIVIFNNAARLPLYDHYQFRDDLPITALPRFPSPANDETIEQLERLALEYERIWFVIGEPIAGLDNNKLVQTWLEENTEKFEQWSFYGHSTAVGLIGFNTRKFAGNHCSDAFELLSEPSNVDQPTLWLQTPSQAGTYKLELQDSSGHKWGETTIEGLTDCEQKSINIGFGLPPGRYQLLESQGHQHISWLEISPANQWNPNFKQKLTQPIHAFWENDIYLNGIIQSSAEFWPGTHFQGQIIWENNSDQPIEAPINYNVRILNPNGDVVIEESGPVTNTEAWPSGNLIATPFHLYASPDLPPGKYELEWQLNAANKTVNGKSGRLFSSASAWVKAGSVEIEEWPLVTNAPTGQEIIGLNASFGENILLHGYEITSAEKEDKQQLDLIWKANEVPLKDYLVFIHILDPQSGQLVTQQDRVPIDWWRPTSGWRTGEFLIDSYRFDIDLSQFDIYVGLYASDTQERLPIMFQDSLQENRQLRLPK